jgi:peptidoglycan/LPS O-acetylase OafA/YrhL
MGFDFFGPSLEVTYPKAAHEWIEKFYNFDPSFVRVIMFSIYNVYFSYNAADSYNSSLWTMRFEFFGSVLLYGYLYFLNKKYVFFKFLDIPILLFLFYNMPILACFHAGSLLHRVKLCKCIEWMEMYFGARGTQCILNISFVLNIFLSAIYRTSDQLVSMYAVFVVLFVLMSNGLERGLNSSVSQFLGEISFPLYLIHMPVIYTFTTNIYAILASFEIDLFLALSINLIATVSLAFALAKILRPLEILCINISKKITKFILNMN